MNTEVMFSSDKDDWETPPTLFQTLDAEFHFDIDVCANQHNTKCSNWLGYSDGGVFCDGLAHHWDGLTCWMNPPYGRISTAQWVKKAYDESQEHGATVVCLLPARTDTKWFHRYIYGKAEIRFIKGRLKFVGAKHGAPFPSMIVIFRGERSGA